MRSLLFSLVVFMVAPLAHAGYGDTFSFSLEKGDGPGCMKVSSISTSYDFPNLNNGTVSLIRFYYSKKSKNDVTENSAYQEARYFEDQDGNKTVSPEEFCGFTAGRYFVKYGLYDTDDQLLEFMPDDEWSSYSNSVEIEEAP